MSVINPRLNKHAQHKVFADEPATTFCNANTALQSAMQKLEPGVKNALLLRCDELPFVQGDENSIEQVFSEVIKMIFGKKDTATKLYLHISSTIDSSEDVNSSLAKSLSQIIIQFHTNITPCSEWMKTAEQKIANLTALLAPFSGSLAVNPLKNSGCIFSISLPGKM